MTKFHPNVRFVEWAKSYAGVDGGNVHGPIWFCGIEPGGSEQNITEHSFVPVKEVHICPEADRDLWFRFQYDQRTLKLYTTILGRPIESYKEVAQEKKVFDVGSDVFKMNLYPLAFKNTEDGQWGRDFFAVTGIPTKEIYRAWCQANRFDLFQKITNDNAETLRLIICTGLGTQVEFLMAFANENIIHARLNEDTVDDCPIRWTTVNGRRTLLVVTPFLGWRKNGLNSDLRIAAFGQKIADLCRKAFGDDWLTSVRRS